jgi:hemin uptake protein HemP
MKTPLKIFAIILVSIFILSCETDITVDLPSPEEKLIVQGKIETGEKPFIFLSRNIGYFEPVNIPEFDESSDITELIKALENSMGLIYDSTVVMTVTDGNNHIDTLIPTIDIFQFPIFGYQAKNMIGQDGQSYRLDITYNGKDFWAETTIPQAVPIDSVWFEFLEENDTIGTLGFHILDPKNTRNFYTIESLVVNEQMSYNPPYIGSFILDDEGFDGDTIKYSPLLKSYNGNDFFDSSVEVETQEEYELDFNRKAYFDFGSTVSLKLSSIDVASYVFWTSFYVHLGTAGNPFTNPASLKSNIVGDNCDGIWAGYGTDIKTVTIDNSLVRE